jgi:hypothetical protein
MRFDGDGSTSNGATKPFSNGSGPSPPHKLLHSPNGSKSSAAMNGSKHSNGRSQQVVKPTSSYFGHDREEVARILIQALGDLGYNEAAATLIGESGYELESPSVAAFRHAVLHGEWARAEDALFGRATCPGEGGVSVNGNGLVLAPGAQKDVMRFWLRQQKFLELLEQRDTARALMVLRAELTPLYQDVTKLHFLSRYNLLWTLIPCLAYNPYSLLMCQSTEDLMVKAEWDGAHGHSRQQLLSELSSM